MPDVHEPELVNPSNTDIDALARRRPDIPTNINELAALKGEAVEIVEARAQVLQTLRRAAMRATSPEDWLLFKSPDDAGGQIIGYLQDAGCDRIRDLYGIEIFNVSRPEKVTGANPAEFHYLIAGSGRCKITRQVVEEMEGGRSSSDDFCKDKTGAALELAVRKAARANLDGNITRELAGMKSVPLDEIVAAWNGTSKNADKCRKGRGFGSRDERLGANAANAPNVEPPVCTHCGAKGVYRPGKGDRGAFYGCPNYQKHADKKWTVDADKWVREQTAKAAASSEPAKPDASKPATGTKRASGAPLTGGEIFGGREPGSEG